MPGDGRLGDQVNRPVRGLGEVLRDGHDQHRDDDADKAREEQVVGIAHASARLQVPVDTHVLRHEVKADYGHGYRHQEPRVQRAHDPARVEDAHEEGAGDRTHHADSAQQQRIDDPCNLALEQQ